MNASLIKMFGNLLVCSFTQCLQSASLSGFWQAIILLVSEELVENAVESIPALLKNRKSKKDLKEEIKNKLENYMNNEFSDKEKKEMLDFIGRIKGAQMPSELSKIMEQADLSTSSCDIDEMRRDGVKKWNENFEKAVREAFEKTHGEIEKIQNTDFNIKVEDICPELFGQEWATLPKPAQKILKMIERQIYKFKYLKLGDEQRDMVLVLSQMVEEKNADLIAQLKPMLNHMAQVNEYAARIDPELKVADIAKADPFCYFPLECPDCHAVGTRVYRDSNNNVHCRSCGKSFGIIQAVQDKDIKEEFKRVRDKLQEEFKRVRDKLQEQCEKSDKISGKIEILASKIVGVEYFDAFQEKIKAQSKNTVLAVTDILEQSESNIKIKLEAIANELKENNFEKIDEKISEWEKAHNDQLNQINDSILKTLEEVLKNGEKISEVNKNVSEVRKSICKVIINQTNNENLLGDIYRIVKNQSKDTGIEEQHLCPRCGLNAPFKRNSNEKYYVCQCCGFSMDEDAFRRGSVSSDAVQMKMERSSDYELKMRYNGKINNDANRSVVCISILDSKVEGMLKDKSLTLSALNWYNGNSLKPTILILRGGNGVRVGEEAVKRIVDLFKKKPSVSHFVFGGGTKAPNAPDFDGWSYDPELHKLSKNT